MEQQEKKKATDQLMALDISDTEKDRIIWEAYSEQGGLYDLLKSFNLAISKPTANAMDYDEDENTYVICVTLYNSIYLRLKRNLDKLQQELNETDRVEKEYITPKQEQTLDKGIIEENKKTHGLQEKIIKLLKTIDCWFMRFQIYKKIRCLFLNDDNDTTKVAPIQLAEAVEIYEEALTNDAYQMQYAELLRRLIKIADEIGTQLVPLHEKNESLLSDYMDKSMGVNRMIEAELFSCDSWIL